MRSIYYAYSLKNEEFLDSFDATSWHEKFNNGIVEPTYTNWKLSLKEEAIVYIQWPKGNWFSFYSSEQFLQPISSDKLPAHLRMQLLVGAL